MKPEDAYKRLLISGPFDDPDYIHYPHRWYFDHNGILSWCAWRSPNPRKYPEFKKPDNKMIKER